MAHHKSAQKRIRRNAKRARINGDRLGRVRTFVRRVELAIANGDKEAALSAFNAAQPELHRGVKAGVLHRNTAARKLSRLTSRIRALD
jgi:small subunit ribosomal protein S20